MHSDNIGQQFAPLFHGTVHPFAPGDVVAPRERGGDAYATPDIDYAHRRAKEAVNFSWEDAKKANPTWNTPGGKQYDEYKAETSPKVFEVRPIGTPEATGDFEDEGNVKSKHGFTVVRQVR
jgi:hypothetical protein